MNDLDIEFSNFQERISEMLDQKIQDACLNYMESEDSKEDSDETNQ